VGPLALAVVRLICALHDVRVRYPWVKAAMLGKAFWTVKLTPPLFCRMARFVYLDTDYINLLNINTSFALLWIAIPSRAVLGFASHFRQVKNSDIARVSR